MRGSDASQISVLVVEDDSAVEGLIRKILEKSNYGVYSSKSVKEASHAIKNLPIDLVLLDRILPDGDGIEVCQLIRSTSELAHIPILFLSHKDAISERVLGLKMGGDDYLPKPFNNTELIARIEALIRRSTKDHYLKKTREIGILTLDLENHKCLIADRSITLRPKEFELLVQFIQSNGRVLNKGYLSETIWNTPHLRSSRAIDTTIQRLRQQLGPYSNAIETVRGYGFRFNADPFLKKKLLAS